MANTLLFGTSKNVGLIEKYTIPDVTSNSKLFSNLQSPDNILCELTNVGQRSDDSGEIDNRGIL